MANGEKGRPTILTPIIEEEIIDAIRQGNYVTTAAALVGISKRAVYEWIRKGEEGEEPYATFNARIQSARADAEMNAVRNIVQAGQDSWQASAWYLERTNYQDWGKKEKLFAEIDSTHTERTEAIIEHQITHDQESRELLAKLFERQQAAENDYNATT